jgi:hypothetical protein
MDLLVLTSSKKAFFERFWPLLESDSYNAERLSALGGLTIPNCLRPLGRVFGIEQSIS